MTKIHIKNISFFLVFIAIVVLFVYVIRFFAAPLFYAILIAAFSYPLYQWIVKKLNGRERLAAFLSILLLFVFVLIPLTIIGVLLIRDSFVLYSTAQSYVGQWVGYVTENFSKLEYLLPQAVREQLAVIDWKSSAVQAVQTVTNFVFTQLQNLTKNAVGVVGMIFIMLYSLFYLYKDGPRWVQKLIEYSPLDDGDERLFIKKFITTAKATLLGTLAIGAVQGILGALAFWVLGITAPIFWGLVIMLLSIVPVIGAFIVWVPVVIVLMIQGSWVAAIFLALYGLFVIGLADNFLRPVLVGSRTKIHPLLILLSTLGGIAIFGFTGIILGPIIAALFLTVLEIYRKRYI